MADFSNLCMGCMSEKGPIAMCPYCGWVQGSGPDSPDELPPGTLLNNRYLVGRKLGRGGFGVTYIGFDLTLRLKLAIKEYFPLYIGHRASGQQLISALGQAKRPDFRTGLDKFLDEARTLAQFANHQNIVSVRDFFEANGTAYMVMSYIDGMTLEQYLDKQPEKRVSFEIAYRIMTPILDALRTVHQAGVIHRDISPDNIFITAGQQVRLLDFGSAKHALSRSSRNFSIVLKPGYAPFEQYYSTSEQGPWTDVYAVGATFYHLIVGKAPPESPARSDYDNLQVPSDLGIPIDMEQEQALLKALAIQPQARIKSIEEFQVALGTIKTAALPPQIVICPYCRGANHFGVGQIAKGAHCSVCGKPLVRKKNRMVSCPYCQGLNEISVDMQPQDFRCSRCGQGGSNFPYRKGDCKVCGLANWVSQNEWNVSKTCVRCESLIDWEETRGMPIMAPATASELTNLNRELPELESKVASNAAFQAQKPKEKGLLVAVVVAVCFILGGIFLFGMQDTKRESMTSNIEKELKLADGGIYSGAHSAGVPEGQGILKYNDGRRFEGLFEKGKFVQGKVVTDEGPYSGDKSISLRYEGELVRGNIKEGNGKLISSDGKIVVYEGDWRDNLRHGRGKSREPYYVKGKGNGQQVYEGQWEKGAKSGLGKAWIYGPDGKEVFAYSGSFRNNRMNDQGAVVFFANGTKYNGPVVFDELHGKGTVTFPDGKSRTGVFQNDKLIEWLR